MDSITTFLYLNSLDSHNSSLLDPPVSLSIILDLTIKHIPNLNSIMELSQLSSTINSLPYRKNSHRERISLAPIHQRIPITIN